VNWKTGFDKRRSGSGISSIETEYRYRRRNKGVVTGARRPLIQAAVLRQRCHLSRWIRVRPTGTHGPCTRDQVISPKSQATTTHCPTDQSTGNISLRRGWGNASVIVVARLISSNESSCPRLISGDVNHLLTFRSPSIQRDRLRQNVEIRCWNLLHALRLAKSRSRGGIWLL